MKNKMYLLLVVFCGIVFSCEDKMKGTSDPPRALKESEVSWRAVSGGAIIKYHIPDEVKNIRGIEARYKLETGKQIIIMKSFLSDSLIVEGYTTESVKEVELYVVDNSNNYSTPYMLRVTPQKGFLSQVEESLEVLPDFGGMQIKWKNKDRFNLALFVSRVDGKDTTLIEQFYSNQANPTLTIRKQKAEKAEYIFQFRDRWNNYTSELCRKITPLFEKKVEVFTYAPADYFHNITDISNMRRWFDGQKSAPGWGDIHWPATSPITPHWSTILFTNPTALSRVVLWQFAWGATNYSHYYFGANTRKLELYGSTVANPKVGDPAITDSWEFIRLCEIKMPSGKWYNSDGKLSEEDFDVAKNRGHEFILPLKDPMPQYRALSFKVIETFQGGGAGSEGGRLSEIEIFGDDRADKNN